MSMTHKERKVLLTGIAGPEYGSITNGAFDCWLSLFEKTPLRKPESCSRIRLFRLTQNSIQQRKQPKEEYEYELHRHVTDLLTSLRRTGEV